jgi:superfamily II DNA/RNA helicase
MAEQGMTFPDIKPPKPVLYELDPALNKLYDETMQLLKFTHTGLKYFRYQAIRFLPKEAQEKFFNNQAEVISDQLAILMKNLLVKRLDSSFYAFNKSLQRYQRNNAAMLKMLENGKVYIAPKLDIADYILNQNDKTEDELEHMLNDPEDETEILVFETEVFDKRYQPGVEKDQEILDELVERWDQVNYDPKLDTFLAELKATFLNPEFNDQKKVVVFSESKETIDYLSERLDEQGIEKVLTVNSGNQKDRAPVIRANFDANIPISEQEDEYNIIITTEVLAEGVNLHRSNVIVNYDIPWNATKLMQRIGRVNRVGTQSDYIYIFNFYPTQEADSEIDLNQKAFIKLQAFHTALGEDSQIYSDEEEYDSFGLFEKVPEEERDERLVFLNFLRRFRDEDPDLYNKIRSSVPLRARTGRKDKTRKLSTLAYLKNEKRDAFYYVDSNGELEELTFVEAARLFEAKVTEKGLKLHEKHHEQVSTAVESFKVGLQQRALETASGNKLGPNEKKAIGVLKMQGNTEFASEDDKKLFKKGREAIAVGKFQKLPREINKLHKQVKKIKSNSEFHQKLIRILESYPLLENKPNEFIQQDEQLKSISPLEPKIIISESFTV